MAFKDVNEKQEGVKLSELGVGQSIEGYIVGFPEGTYGTNLKMEIEGEAKLVFSSGNIKWMIKDKKLKLGMRTRITRLKDEVGKGQKGSFKKTVFKVEQDPEDVTASPVEEQAAKGPQVTPQENFKSKIEELKAGK